MMISFLIISYLSTFCIPVSVLSILRFDQQVGILVSSVLATHLGLNDKRASDIGRGITEHITQMIIVWIIL